MPSEVVAGLILGVLLALPNSRVGLRIDNRVKCVSLFCAQSV